MQPTHRDVLFGRGKAATMHEGTVYLRDLAMNYRQKYLRTPKMMKGDVIKEIVKILKSENRKFYYLNEKANMYEEASETRIYHKIGHLLRARSRILTTGAEADKRSTQEDKGKKSFTIVEKPISVGNIPEATAIEYKSKGKSTAMPEDNAPLRYKAKITTCSSSNPTGCECYKNDERLTGSTLDPTSLESKTESSSEGEDIALLFDMPKIVACSISQPIGCDCNKKDVCPAEFFQGKSLESKGESLRRREDNMSPMEKERIDPFVSSFISQPNGFNCDKKDLYRCPFPEEPLNCANSTNTVELSQADQSIEGSLLYKENKIPAFADTTLGCIEIADEKLPSLELKKERSTDNSCVSSVLQEKIDTILRDVDSKLLELGQLLEKQESILQNDRSCESGIRTHNHQE